ncbi:fatty acid/sphingolipid desaturase [Coccomyxa subellipsoidea C-169]|uniref:Fatty acid/sphingolipid desaturase n=1 Tax=Coccomyxa subellipsoidea (strain C-169) TaxID=574566 RepID=I0YW09_COCSC|nr:fatty acid/sphingolipid desaturase [Coccomyxa subellipsoidea C-169]EIE22578.1 fatty acid/sphingolipid desaturase [Coccomyxa subellipsoidea C-169]|eukprot:XP_005647122.1 fatty acid/sphingolipid desaturase [Coccomyxa subellipsoidea C-169]
MCIPAATGRPVTWKELKLHATAEDLWVAVNGRAYDLTEYQHLHPGSALILQHVAGTDASEAFQAFKHPTSARLTMLKYGVGFMESAREKPRTDAAQQLIQVRSKMEAAGLFRVNYWNYVVLAAGLAVAFIAVLLCVKERWVVPGALLLSLFWQQLALVGHDVGHNQILRTRSLDSMIGIGITLFLGASVQWWKYNHNTHHVTPNSSEHDPDIQHLPFFALSNQFFRNLRSTFYQATMVFDNAVTKMMISVQHYTFLPMMLVARFGFYAMSTFHLLAKGRPAIYKPFEVAAFLGFFTWYLALCFCLPTWTERILFFVISHACFGIINLQMAATNNVSCPEWMDWFHGGLQYQIEHHLYPDLPRHHLRAASAYVRPMCAKLGIKYHSPTFFQAIGEVLGALKVVASQARNLPKEHVLVK